MNLPPISDRPSRVVRAPVYQSLWLVQTDELITMAVDDRQASGEACITCAGDIGDDDNPLPFGRLIGAATGLLVTCGPCQRTSKLVRR